MVVDSADGYIFLSEGGSGSASGIVVTSLAGSYVTTLDAGDGVQGIALSDGTLYAALDSSDSVGVIDAATLTQTQAWALPAGDVPNAVAVQSGKLWVTYGGVLGDFDLSSGTFQAGLAAGGWSSLAADPSDTGVLIAAQQGSSPSFIAAYNTAVTPITPLAGPSVVQDCTNENQVAVIPGGSEFVTACSSPYSAYLYDTNNLASPVTSYPIGAYPSAVAVAADGTLAAGSTNAFPAIHVYSPSGTELNDFSLGGDPSLPAQGLAWSTNGSTLYAITQSGSGFTLRVFDSPELTQSALTLSAPSTAGLGTSVTVAGKLSLSTGVPAAGTPVTVTRANPDGSTTTLTPEQTDSSGAFSLTDTPHAVGSYTYTASYAGSASIAPAQATATLTVALNTATLSLTASQATVMPGSSVTITGTLAFGTGVPATGTPVTVTRSNPDGTTSTLAPAQTDASGDFSLTDTPPALGSYTYTASYTGDATTATAQATAKVTVALDTATITLSGPATVRPGQSFSIPGKLSLGSGTPAAGTLVTVKRVNPNGTATSISAIKTTATGTFTIPDKLSALGSYSYTASVPATSTTAAASTTAKLAVAKAAAPLSLAVKPATGLYDSTITVTAHLGSTYTNRVVSVYAQLVGSGTKKLLKTAAVNSSGNLVISYPAATRNVWFTATFSGDAQYLSRSYSVRVGIAARVAMTNSGWYATNTYSGTVYHVFHHTAPLNTAITVTPNKHGECVRLDIEGLVGTTWTSAANGLGPCHALTSASTLTGYVDLTQATYGGRYRLQVIFYPSSTDVTNISYYSSWFYFQVVK
jgi:hypothetical protein